MIDELQRLGELRPDVPPPRADARRRARERLELETIAAPAAPPGSPTRDPRRRAPRLGALAVVVAALAAVVVAVGAIALLGHRRTSPPAAGHARASRGAILDSGGGALVAARRHLSTYPFRFLAAQVLGVVGPITRNEARERGAAGATPDEIVGQTGLEATYDSWLRQGDRVRTSLAIGLERAGEDALQRAITLNRATGGAFVAMDPSTGAVDAIGSLPSFNPSVLVGGSSSASYRRLTNPADGDPLLNRATQSSGPVGATLEPITALAALESGAWTTDEDYDDTGQFCSDGECRHNSGRAAYGAVNLTSALRLDAGDFFDNLGALTNSSRPRGGALQHWAAELGIGSTTGVDLPAEAPGTLPTPGWRAHQNELETECEKATGPFRGHPAHPASQGGCGIAVTPEEPWTVGDNINLAVGQGDVQVTLLQLAVAYAALANGGTVVTPHVGADIETGNGRVLRRIGPAPRRHLNLNPGDLAAVRAGLRGAATDPGGTTTDVFDGFPYPVYGLAGTTQSLGPTGHVSDTALFAGYVPATATRRPVVVVVEVDDGGFGSVAAAPVARRLLSQWLLGRAGPWRPGTSTAF